MIATEFSIALVTYGGEPNLTEDDRLLQREIERLGSTATAVCWDDRSIDWRTVNLAVVRSTWDYIFHLEAFRRWIESVSAETTLVNDQQLLVWNLDKRYLFDLQAKRVAIVPSVLVRQETAPDEALSSAMVQFDGRIVIKPTVSCGSHLARHYSITNEQAHKDASAHLRLVLRHSAALIQPLLAEVFDGGERSLVFFNGVYSHTAPKEPFREGLSPTYPSKALHSNESEIRFCASTLLRLPSVPTYARVDIIEHDAQLLVNEVELIEPELHFHLKRNSVTRLALILLDRCQHDVR